METTQKQRKAPKADGAETARPKTARQKAAPPPSAQQKSGAVKTAETQRSRPEGKPRREAPADAVPKKKAPAAKEKPAAKKPAQKPARAEKPAKKPVKAEKPALKKKVPSGAKAPVKQDPDDISNKKRAYGKSKPKKKTVVEVVGEKLMKKRATKKNKKSSRAKQPTPAVIYTQPQAFNRNRLLVQLLTVVAVVVALVMGLSVFFKVENIQVSGAEVYSEWAIREASGLNEGDNLLTFSHARSAALIKANLPYVDTVRFGIKLPDTVNIIVKEDDVVYAIKDQNGQWWLMNSDGRIVEMGDNSKASGHTQILGVALENPVPNERAVAMEMVPAETLAEGETQAVISTTGAQRLTAALQILRALEDNDIVGSAASVDVTRIEDIILWYGTRYQVNLGDSARLDYKIACMNDVILQMSDYQSGILDISFTIWPNQVGYTPFA